jgi:hypothetical protein
MSVLLRATTLRGEIRSIWEEIRSWAWFNMPVRRETMLRQIEEAAERADNRIDAIFEAMRRATEYAGITVPENKQEPGAAAERAAERRARCELAGGLRVLPEEDR